MESKEKKNTLCSSIDKFHILTMALHLYPLPYLGKSLDCILVMLSNCCPWIGWLQFSVITFFLVHQQLYNSSKHVFHVANGGLLLEAILCNLPLSNWPLIFLVLTEFSVMNPKKVTVISSSAVPCALLPF